MGNHRITRLNACLLKIKGSIRRPSDLCYFLVISRPFEVKFWVWKLFESGSYLIRNTESVKSDLNSEKDVRMSSTGRAALLVLRMRAVQLAQRCMPTNIVTSC